MTQCCTLIESVKPVTHTLLHTRLHLNLSLAFIVLQHSLEIDTPTIEVTRKSSTEESKCQDQFDPISDHHLCDLINSFSIYEWHLHSIKLTFTKCTPFEKQAKKQ